MAFKKISTLVSEYRHLTVVTGSRTLFFICFWLTKVFSLLARSHPVVDTIIHHIVKRLPTPAFVIKNDRGIYAVTAFDDSTTICSSYFETELRDWLDQTSTKDLFVDIGANRGLYTVTAIRHHGFSAVHAFEPNPDMFATLKKNVALNHLESATHLYNAGIGDSAASHLLTVDPLHAGGGRIAKDPHQHEMTVSVQIITLDTALTPADMSRVGFVKIDTEGYEKNVLAGMPTTLTHMPKGACLMIETAEPDDIATIVSTYGFTRAAQSNNDHLFQKTMV